ncbi:MAG: agmatine deiminase family protein [Ilumatobacteraceae bacterium]
MSRFRLPGEWVPHERTIMFWPCRRTMWGEYFDEVIAESQRVANTIAEFEPLTMVAADEEGAAVARRMLTGHVDVRVIPMDGSWSRDNGPIYVTDGTEVEARHVVFNSYGERHAKRDRDARAGATLARQLGHRVSPIDVVMEGGAIATDGAGTLVATEHCVLNPNRNWHLTKDEVEARLLEGFGLDRMVWLPGGPLFDRGPNNSDGHTDLILQFVDERRALLMAAFGPDDESAAIHATNKAILEAAGYEIIDVPLLATIHHGDVTVRASYLNIYLCNGAVLIPVPEEDPDLDAEAVRIIGGAFPDRTAIPLRMRAHPVHGGAIHCITQQVPATSGGATR